MFSYLVVWQIFVHFQLVRFTFTLHWVKLSKPFEKLVPLLTCGGATLRTTEGTNMKTSERNFLCKM